MTEAVQKTMAICRMTMEKHRVDHFLRRFDAGHYSGQRLGQAFYTEFLLSRLRDQNALQGLYEKDGTEARKLIFSLFDLS